MSVTLLDYIDSSLPVIEKENNYKAVTKSVNIIDSIIPDLNKAAQNIKEDLDLEGCSFDTRKLEEEIRNVKGQLIDKCINRARKEFPSLYFNERILVKFGHYLKPFDGKTFIKYIQKRYEDVDYITLEQWRYAIIEETVSGKNIGDHWQRWDERTNENIEDINSSGIELHFWPSHFTQEEILDYIVKFANFALGNSNTQIPEIKGLDIPFKDMEAGKAYQIRVLKSVRHYQKDRHKLKISFKSPEDRDKFKTLLFTPTWEILGRGQPEQPSFKDACDICLYKDVSCLQCNNYDHWVGSCEFCQKNILYPTRWDRNNDCENCKLGITRNFTPIKESENITGLVKEEGYYHHVWSARPYKDEKYLKIHCLGFGIGTLYKYYKSAKYSAPICSWCRAGITEYEKDSVKMVCTSQRALKHKHNNFYYIYNCKGTLTTKTETKEVI
jgi:hypothetical protein